MKLNYSYAHAYDYRHRKPDAYQNVFSALCTLIEVFLTVYASTRDSTRTNERDVAPADSRAELDQVVRRSVDDPEAFAHA